MPWQPVITNVLRTLINDVDPTNYSFTDERLQNVIIVAAQLTQGEMDFAQTYIIDVDAVTISPDPVDGHDYNFTNLAALRANVIIADSTYRTVMLKAGYRVKDGDSSIDTTGLLLGYKQVVDWAKTEYERVKDQYIAGNLEVGRAILSPMSSPTLNFTGYSYDPRDRTWYSRGVV